MRLPSLATFAALPGILLLTGCSFLYDLSPDQCGNTADCAAFGENYACVEGICKGDSRAECEVAPDCKDFATAPTACIEKVRGNPGSRVCEPLRTTECPMIMPTGGPGQELWRAALTTRDPIIVGGFAETEPDDISTYSAAYDLAFTELQQTRDGVSGPNGTRRSIVAVVCNNGLDAVGMSDAMEHLTEDLLVPGVISAMRSDQLRPLFSNVRNSANNPNVLFMSPGEADKPLESIQDSDLIWTLLPRAVQLAAVYPPLLERAIDHLIARNRLVAGDPIKVTLLSADDLPLLDELSDAVEDILEFNGKSFADNLADGNAQRLDVTSAFEDPNADLSGKIAEIADFAPNVIVAISADELFSKIIPGIEPDPSPGGSGQVAPFYLLSPYHNQSRSLNLGFLNNYRVDPIEVRMAGVQYAAAPEEFEPYVAEFQQRFLDLFPDDARSGYENFADAPWWLIYSIAAGAGTKSTFDGNDLLDGMERLQEGTPFFMGPDDVDAAMTALLNDANSSIQLNGTLGPPSFDNTGIRQSLGSVWCIQPSAEQLTDVLRLDEATGELVEDSNGGFLQCHPGFMPPF